MSRNRLSDRHTEFRVENSTNEFQDRIPVQKSNTESKIELANRQINFEAKTD